MIFIVTVLVLFFSFYTNAQAIKTIDLKTLQKEIEQSKLQLKQMNASIDSGFASKTAYLDSINNSRNIENVIAFSKELQAREKANKKKAFIKIGIGILFAIVFVIGMLRKRKK
jgi:sensor c-di-GMP phosphodiesterase-like protein